MLGLAAVGAGLAAGTMAWGSYAPNSGIFGRVIGRGPREPVAYLTFDDGPNPGATDRVLEILDLEKVPATFFMVGRHVERHRRTALSVAQAGHDIGNHTYSHIKLHRTGPRRAMSEIRRGHEAIANVTGYTPRTFRAPHGYRSPFVSRAIAPYGYRTVGWTLGVWDSALPGAERIRSRVRAGLSPGAIVLLHDGDGYHEYGDRRQTVEALSGIIADARAAGYRLESLARLVAG